MYIFACKGMLPAVHVIDVQNVNINVLKLNIHFDWIR